MAFANIGSADVESLLTWNAATPIDITSVAVPDLGANRVGIAIMLKGGAGTTNLGNLGATWNGVAMTFAVAGSNGGRGVLGLWYLVGAADNGNYTIRFTNDHESGAIGMYHGVAVWADATGVISLDDTSSETGTTQNPDIVSTQATANELVISGSGSSANAISSPSTTGCTELQVWDYLSDCTITAYSQPAGSGDATHQHNYSAEGDYGMASASFQEAGGTEQKTATPSDNIMA